jgi:hypothetical protein
MAAPINRVALLTTTIRPARRGRRPLRIASSGCRSVSSATGDAGAAPAGQAGRFPVRVSEDVSSMARVRYEVRVNGALSERARGAFHALDVASVPAQTIVFGELAEVADLGDLMALCSAMGLEVVSLRRLPCPPAAEPWSSVANGARVQSGTGQSAGSRTDQEGRPDRGAQT